MLRQYLFTMRIISTITLIAFVSTQVAFGYPEGRGLSGQAQKSHIRSQQFREVRKAEQVPAAGEARSDASLAVGRAAGAAAGTERLDEKKKELIGSLKARRRISDSPSEKELSDVLRAEIRAQEGLLKNTLITINVAATDHTNVDIRWKVPSPEEISNKGAKVEVETVVDGQVGHTGSISAQVAFAQLIRWILWEKGFHGNEPKVNFNNPYDIDDFFGTDVFNGPGLGTTRALFGYLRAVGRPQKRKHGPLLNLTAYLKSLIREKLRIEEYNKTKTPKTEITINEGTVLLETERALNLIAEWFSENHHDTTYGINLLALYVGLTSDERQSYIEAWDVKPPSAAPAGGASRGGADAAATGRRLTERVISEAANRIDEASSEAGLRLSRRDFIAVTSLAAMVFESRLINFTSAEKVKIAAVDLEKELKDLPPEKAAERFHLYLRDRVDDEDLNALAEVFLERLTPGYQEEITMRINRADFPQDEKKLTLAVKFHGQKKIKELLFYDNLNSLFLRPMGEAEANTVFSFKQNQLPELAENIDAFAVRLGQIGAYFFDFELGIVIIGDTVHISKGSQVNPGKDLPKYDPVGNIFSHTHPLPKYPDNGTVPLSLGQGVSTAVSPGDIQALFMTKELSRAQSLAGRVITYNKVFVYSSAADRPWYKAWVEKLEKAEKDFENKAISKEQLDEIEKQYYRDVNNEPAIASLLKDQQAYKAGKMSLTQRLENMRQRQIGVKVVYCLPWHPAAAKSASAALANSIGAPEPAAAQAAGGAGAGGASANMAGMDSERQAAVDRALGEAAWEWRLRHARARLGSA